LSELSATPRFPKPEESVKFARNQEAGLWVERSDQSLSFPARRTFFVAWGNRRDRPVGARNARALQLRNRSRHWFACFESNLRSIEESRLAIQTKLGVAIYRRSRTAATSFAGRDRASAQFSDDGRPALRLASKRASRLGRRARGDTSA